MDDQPNPLSLPPEAPSRRRADRSDRVDRPDIEVSPSPPVFPDFDETEHGRPPGAPPPRRGWRSALRYLIALLIVAGLILWLVCRSAPPRSRKETCRSR